jgi:hypothetical protein
MFGRCVYDGGRIALGNTSVSSVAAAAFELTNDGTYTGSDASNGNWLAPPNAGIAALCSVTATLNSGSLNSGTVGTPLNLGTSRSWSTLSSAGLTRVFSGAGGPKTVTLTLTAL